MKKGIYILLVVSSIVISFFVGSIATKREAAQSISQIQANLSFAHYQAYNGIRSDLLKSCRSRAEAKLQQKAKVQKMLMAEYYQETGDAYFRKYVDKRDKQLIEQLKNYKVDWSQKVVLPECKSEKK